MTEQPRDDIDRILTERAAAFDEARTLRAAEAERLRAKRARRVNLQFWFLFVVLFGALFLLAYRTEVTQHDLRQGLYDACQQRVAASVSYNEGREALIAAVLNDPDSTMTEAEKVVAEKQLRDGLLLPVEDCGAAPE